MFRSPSVLIALAATASLGWGAAPAVAGSPPPNDNYLSSTIIPQGSTTGMSLVTYHDTEDLTAATTQRDLFNPDQSGLPFGGGGLSRSRAAPPATGRPSGMTSTPRFRRACSSRPAACQT